MKSITLHSRTGPDGLLNLQIPTDAPNQDVVVVVDAPHEESRDDHSWPAGYFDRTAGSLAGIDFNIDYEGDFEARSELN